jgi:lambda repressor-like predicted transcriptional regulator
VQLVGWVWRAGCSACDSPAPPWSGSGAPHPGDRLGRRAGAAGSVSPSISGETSVAAAWTITVTSCTAPVTHVDTIGVEAGHPHHRCSTFGTFRTAFKTSGVGGSTVGPQGLNERLRVAMAANGMEVETLARSVGVDPKTVQRWLRGRVPHPRHRWKICDLLGHSEQELWPQVGLGASGTAHTAEIVCGLRASR